MSSGLCNATAVAAAATGAACYASATAIAAGATYNGLLGLTTDTERVIAAYNLAPLAATSDQALKVSYFITDSTGGLEAGDNAVMVEGFATMPMATNQQPLSFGTAGKLAYDPINFELPNLAYGAYPSSVAARQVYGATDCL